MDCDPEAESFAKSLFTYLWFTESLVSGKEAAETVGEVSDFVSDVAKAVVILSALSMPTFNDHMEDYFKSHDLSRKCVFTFLAKYCFDDHAQDDNIFRVVLNTLTFVYRLAIFCRCNGQDEYLDFAAMCWTEIFQMDLREDFYTNGGWGEFGKYITSNSYIAYKDGSNGPTDFMNFMEEINCLFPKLGVCDTGPVFVPFQGTETGRVSWKRKYEEDSSCEESDQSADDNAEATPRTALTDKTTVKEHLQKFLQTCKGSTETSSSDENNETIIQELVQTSLTSIRQIDVPTASPNCMVCCSHSGEEKTVCHNDTFCPKHDPDSFYYWVTHSEVEEV